jgi:hypothetical protein
MELVVWTSLIWAAPQVKGSTKDCAGEEWVSLLPGHLSSLQMPAQASLQQEAPKWMLPAP